MACAPLLAQEIPYSIGSWPELAHGNHRAVLQVATGGNAVHAHIPWRRRDLFPEKKLVYVTEASGNIITNTLTVNITRESGDIIFAPISGPGTYYVYYLPYTPGVGNFDDPGSYYTPKDTADPTWLAANGLDVAANLPARMAALPQASVTGIQARTEFDSFYPMEVIATSDETSALAAKVPDYTVFAEDRKYPIRMTDDLPQKWIESGPVTSFSGTAQPNEIYTFQVGVWAAHKPLGNLSLKFSDMTGATGTRIPASAFHCINLGGVDQQARAFTKIVNVGAGKVQALWVYVRIPKTAAGMFTGSATLGATGEKPTRVNLSIAVSGPMLADGGVSDLWRMSRLAWLDSTRAEEEAPIPPYTPVKASGNTISILNRSVSFGKTGLPAQIISNGRKILASPMAFNVSVGGKNLPFTLVSQKTLKSNAGVVEREYISKSGALTLTAVCRMEFDGMAAWHMSLTADKDISLSNASLSMPVAGDVAKYMMGMGKRGGFRPSAWDWSWSTDHADNMLWIGDYNAGVQLKLVPQKDIFSTTDLRDAGLPVSWCNDGAGGCRAVEVGKTFAVTAFSGARQMKAHETLDYDFRLLITPFKPIDPRHWDWQPNKTVGLSFQGALENPYINYPFLHTDRIANYVKGLADAPATLTGHINYDVRGNLNPYHGSISLWVTCNFDSANMPVNQSLLFLRLANSQCSGMFWCKDKKTIRVYNMVGSVSPYAWPLQYDCAPTSWKKGEKHVLTLSWGDELAMYMDGKLIGSCPYTGLSQNLCEDGQIVIGGGLFTLDAVKVEDIPFADGILPVKTQDAHTLLLDTFANVKAGLSVPDVASGKKRGEIFPGVKVEQVAGGSELVMASQGKTPFLGLDLYYTVRELSNHVVEIWPLRSLGDEIFASKTMQFTSNGGVLVEGGGGYPWLVEHLGSGYVPAWRSPMPWMGETDAAIATSWDNTRWFNYYVEGISYMMARTGINGLYLDGAGYDRNIMRRVARVMGENDPAYRIKAHSANIFDYTNIMVNSLNGFMEQLPYESNLWSGEFFEYTHDPDYWLVEISGIPFGLTSEMLDYQIGGNAYRGMLYAMNGRFLSCYEAINSLWEDYDIKETQMIGYWDPACPVKTDNANIYATVYKGKDRSIVSIGSWSHTDEDLGLTINWKALSLDCAHVRIIQPALEDFQPAAKYAPGEKIRISAGKGAILVLEKM